MIGYAWDSATTNPLMATRTSLKRRAGVSALNVFKADLRRTHSGHETFQVLACIPHSLISKAESFSGSDGVFCWAIRSDEAQKQIRTVWLPTHTDLTVVQRQCKRVENLDLFANERGFGVRVKAENFEVASTMLLGSDGANSIAGDIYEPEHDEPQALLEGEAAHGGADKTRRAASCWLH